MPVKRRPLCTDHQFMIRGLYTGASGMLVQQHFLDAISNNLANADTTAYKMDEPIAKAFPELLLRRMNTDVIPLPYSQSDPVIGSQDKAPVVGKLGTGVELNEVFTEYTQGAMKETKNPFDLALEGNGFYVVDTPYGQRLTRNGSFMLGPEGLIVTKEGYPLLGENGPLQVKANNVVIDEDGKVFQNNKFAGDPNRLVSMEENQWDDTVMIDRLKIVRVDQPRYLQKQGSSLYLDNENSGPAFVIPQEDRPKTVQGFLEASNVNPVNEMVKMIEVNRAYEANQKVIQSEDQAAEKLLTQVFRV
jgi:flagellar basal-body rod protein FlgG